MHWDKIGDLFFTNLLSILNPSWPQITLFMGGFAIYLFREEIKPLLRRVNAISHKGITFEAQATIQPDIHNPQVEEMLKGIESTPVTQEIEAQIKETLNKGNLKPEAAYHVLLTHLANAFTTIRFGQVYYTIFNSQIYFLRKLNELRSEGVTKDKIENFFKGVQAKFPEALKGWTVDNYLQFLLSSGVIRVDANKYFITVFGVEFLAWMQRTGMPESRPL